MDVGKLTKEVWKFPNYSLFFFCISWLSISIHIHREQSHLLLDFHPSTSYCGRGTSGGTLTVEWSLRMLPEKHDSNCASFLNVACCSHNQHVPKTFLHQHFPVLCQHLLPTLSYNKGSKHLAFCQHSCIQQK